MLRPNEINAPEYFHGTNMEYVQEQIRKHGRYQHDTYYEDERNPVLITIHRDNADKYAHDRSKVLFTGKTPIRLVVDGHKVRDRVYEDPETTFPALDFILENEFSLVELD